jgi:hypothetical protein
MSVGGKTLIIVLHPKESFGVEERIRNLDFLLKDTRILLPLYFKPIRNQLLKWILPFGSRPSSLAVE